MYIAPLLALLHTGLAANAPRVMEAPPAPTAATVTPPDPSSVMFTPGPALRLRIVCEPLFAPLVWSVIADALPAFGSIFISTGTVAPAGALARPTMNVPGAGREEEPSTYPPVCVLAKIQSPVLIVPYAFTSPTPSLRTRPLTVVEPLTSTPTNPLEIEASEVVRATHFPVESFFTSRLSAETPVASQATSYLPRYSFPGSVNVFCASVVTIFGGKSSVEIDMPGL